MLVASSVTSTTSSAVGLRPAYARSFRVRSRACSAASAGYTLIETFETLFRPWNIENTSVRPFHRMVAHTGFITVARRVVPEDSPFQPRISMPEVD